MSLFTNEIGRRPLLVVLCGPSHAGKTTFANRLSKSDINFAIISPDQIRKRLSVSFQDSRYESRVWDIYESMKRKALEKGCNVVLDACHISKRARWHALQGPNDHHKKICVVFDLSWQTIRERCLKGKRLSLDEAERMWQAFQKNKPTPRELKIQGFNDVYFIREGAVCAEAHKQHCQLIYYTREKPKAGYSRTETAARNLHKDSSKNMEVSRL